MAVDIIKGTDREFVLRIVKKSNDEPFDLSGLAGDAIELKMFGEENDLSFTLDENANFSKLEVISALGGKIKVVISDLDSALLKRGDNQNMELTIKEGAGPDFQISKVQFIGQLNVKESLFD